MAYNDDALVTLGQIKSAMETVRLVFTTASVTTAGWSADSTNGGFQQTVTATGITAIMKPTIDVYHASGVNAQTFADQCEAFAEFAASGWADASNGQITLHCYEKPSANFTIAIKASL